MARKVNVIVTDDLDGSAGAGAVLFSLDGQGYEIDLGPANQAQLQTSLQPFIDAARRTSRASQPGRGPGPTWQRSVRGPQSRECR